MVQVRQAASDAETKRLAEEAATQKAQAELMRCETAAEAVEVTTTHHLRCFAALLLAHASFIKLELSSLTFVAKS